WDSSAFPCTRLQTLGTAHRRGAGCLPRASESSFRRSSPRSGTLFSTLPQRLVFGLMQRAALQRNPAVANGRPAFEDGAFESAKAVIELVDSHRLAGRAENREQEIDGERVADAAVNLHDIVPTDVCFPPALRNEK